MHLIIFTENNQNGGLDTFISSLINNWPNYNDDFTIICNKSHPGLKNLKNSIDKKVHIIDHEIPLVWDLGRMISNIFPSILAKLIKYFLRIILMPIQYIKISKIFKNLAGNKLLVVNGGYPGGETCRIANIAWFNLGKGRGIHNFHNFASNYRFGFSWFDKFIDRKLIKSTQVFISVSRVCAKSLLSRGKIWHQANIDYIYNGVSDKNTNHLVNLRKDFKIGSSPLCLMLGTYEERKGHEFVFKVFKRVLNKIPNAHLIICGGRTDNEYNAVKKLKDKIVPGPNVILIDFIPNGANLISQSDLLLIGSQSYESFGYTAVEAMIRKKVVVSTNTGGLVEVIKDNEGGFVFNKDDYDGYADKVLQLLENKKLRIEVGSKGRERAESKFLSNRMSKEYFILLND